MPGFPGSSAEVLCPGERELGGGADQEPWAGLMGQIKSSWEGVGWGYDLPCFLFYQVLCEGALAMQ